MLALQLIIWTLIISATTYAVLTVNKRQIEKYNQPRKPNTCPKCKGQQQELTNPNNPQQPAEKQCLKCGHLEQQLTYQDMQRILARYK